MRNLILIACLVMTAQFTWADSVNIYSFRQPFLIEPILAQFTKETGIETKVVFAKDGLIQRLKREGKLSPADVVLTSDFSKLLQVKEEGLSQADKLRRHCDRNRWETQDLIGAPHGVDREYGSIGIFGENIFGDFRIFSKCLMF